MEDLCKEALKKFAAQFGSDKPANIAAFAPGRVNLIGEHTDYNDGFVFPMAIEHGTVIVGLRNDTDKCAVLTCADVGDETNLVEFDAPKDDKPLAPGEPKWANYVKGVINQFDNGKGIVPGFNAVIVSNVPLGSGLSSSASLEVATLYFIEQLCPDAEERTESEKALLCQQAEHKFAGVKCGVMDQFISVMGKAGHALLLDCRPPYSPRLIKLDNPDVVFLICNTKVRHELASGEYNKRRETCNAAAEKMAKPSLRDASIHDLEMKKSVLAPDEYRRARHVITEGNRVIVSIQSIQVGDYKKFGQLMKQSHTSLKDDYQVSCAELDKVVELALQIQGVYGSRMTGGGFGGCTVSLVEKSFLQRTMDKILSGYPSAEFFVSSPGDGAKVIDLTKLGE